MVWEIIWSRTAERQLERIAKSNKKIAQSIVDKLGEIIDDPFFYTDKMRKINLRKLRAGDYRIIVKLEQQKMIIFVVETGPRGAIYKNY